MNGWMAKERLKRTEDLFSVFLLERLDGCFVAFSPGGSFLDSFFCGVDSRWLTFALHLPWWFFPSPLLFALLGLPNLMMMESGRNLIEERGRRDNDDDGDGLMTL